MFLKKTVTSIRNSYGTVRVNPVTSITRQYIIFGTTNGQLSLYSHNEHLENGELNSRDLTLEWSIIAHEPSKGPYNDDFGSLCKTIILNLFRKIIGNMVYYS